MKKNNNNFTKKINKNIARFSNSKYYNKNLQWFKEASKERPEFMHLDGRQYPYFYPHFTLEGYCFLETKCLDLIGVRKSNNEEWNFIPLPLLIDIMFGKNISKKTRIKKYIKFINSCDFSITRNEWESF